MQKPRIKCKRVVEYSCLVYVLATCERNIFSSLWLDANKNISTIPNTDIKDPEKLDVDNSTKAENGKTVSENADFLGSPQAKVMLAASNKGHNSVFQDGPKTEILRLRDCNARLLFGISAKFLCASKPKIIGFLSDIIALHN